MLTILVALLLHTDPAVVNTVATVRWLAPAENSEDVKYVKIIASI